MNRIIALLSLCATAAAQGGANDLPLNNGGDVIFGPSGGASVGSNPATGTWGELYWRALPGDRVLADEQPSGAPMLVPPTLGGPACFHGLLSGALTTCQIPVAPVAPVAQPVDVYWQGISIDPASGVATATNRVRTTLY